MLHEDNFPRCIGYRMTTSQTMLEVGTEQLGNTQDISTRVFLYCLRDVHTN